MSLSAHQRPHRGASDVWLTPPDIIAAVGPFDLDPCAAPEPRPWPTATDHITLPDDGLSSEWNWGDAFVWCNPPFGPEAGKWLDRMGQHRNGIALCPARTETRWFIRGVWQSATTVLFLHGRPHFHHADGTRGKANSGAPIVLVGYGPTADQRLASCGLPGSLVRLPTPGGLPWPAAPPSPPERAQPEWTAAELLAELKDRTERAMVEMEQVAATGSGEWHHRSLGKLAGLALVADWLRSYDHHAAPVQPRGDELGVLREAVERFYRVDGYPAAMQVVRAAESLLAASPATADRTATSDDLGPEEWDGLLAGDHTADRTDGPDA